MPTLESTPVPPTILRDGRLVLRPPVESDIPAITAACQDPELWRWLEALPNPYRTEDALGFVTKQTQAWAQELADGQERVFAITAAEDGRLLGMVGLHDFAELRHPTGGRAEVGFWIVAAERGRSVMTDAVRLVCAYGFDALGLARIEWQAETGNWASRRVIEKLGFQFVGTSTDRLLHYEDRVDGWLAGISRAEFEGFTPLAKAPLLETTGLRLRPWNLGDAASVLVLAEDPLTIRWSPSLREVRTLEEACGWIARRSARLSDWAATDAATGELVGRVGLHNIFPEDSCAEIGYGVLPAFRRRGIAGRLVAAVTDYAFAPSGLDLNRVCLQHGLGNTGSCAVAMASGFPLEGVQRQAIVAPDGTFDDAHLHARLASDPPVDR